MMTRFPELCHLGLLLLLTASLSLVGCSGSGGPDNGSETGGREGGAESAVAGKRQVSVAGSQWYGNAPAWVGIFGGIFREYDLRVNYQTVESAEDRMNLLRSGKIDFASVDEITMLKSLAAGNDQFYWVGSQNLAQRFEALVVKGEVVRSWADLKGKHIALPKATSVEVTVRLLLEEKGLEPVADVRLLHTAPEDLVAALRDGEAVAVGAREPILSEVLELPGVRALGWDTDTFLYEKYKTMSGPDVLLVSKSWADTDPEGVRHFLGAYFEALDVLVEDKETAAKKAARMGFPPVKDEAKVLAVFEQISWQGAYKQVDILSERELLGQADEICRILKEDMQVIDRIPDFRKRVRTDLIPE